jgi:adenine specific DNA methylase Mod
LQDYQDITTDSLWIIDKRGKSGSHRGDYHGNFIPQIPNQLIKLIRRFTKRGNIVLGLFLGSGTTLIECKRLDRSRIGVELLPAIAKITLTLLKGLSMKTKVLIIKFLLF